MTTFNAAARESYDVWGSTLQEVVDAISQYPEAGAAEWFPAYNVECDDSGTVVRATVTVDQRITMPNWVDYPNASDAAKAEWDRFSAALEAHEQGHLDIVRQQLEGLDEQLVGLTPADAEAAFQAAVAQLQQASNDYDTSTDHGRSTGTVVDLDADQRGGE